MRISQGERIKQLMEHLGVNQTDFGKRFGIPKSTLSSYISNNRKMKQDRIRSICEPTGISEAWLLGFDVPMYNEEGLSDAQLEMSEILDDTEIRTRDTDEYTLLQMYRSLNTDGKQEAKKRISELTMLPMWSAKKEMLETYSA